jgi:hypothetical protein
MNSKKICLRYLIQQEFLSIFHFMSFFDLHFYEFKVNLNDFVINFGEFITNFNLTKVLIDDFINAYFRFNVPK